MRKLLRNLWWWIRGVDVDDYRKLCLRCGRAGQVHFSLDSRCPRFK